MRIEMVKTVLPLGEAGVGDEAGSFDSVRWWQTRPAAERLMAVEELRAQHHGWKDKDESRPQLLCVCQVLELK